LLRRAKSIGTLLGWSRLWYQRSFRSMLGEGRWDLDMTRK
jgi:hypothetical protein